jgi:hypothetical protein
MDEKSISTLMKKFNRTENVAVSPSYPVETDMFVLASILNAVSSLAELVGIEGVRTSSFDIEGPLFIGDVQCSLMAV